MNTKYFAIIVPKFPDIYESGGLITKKLLHEFSEEVKSVGILEIDFFQASVSLF